MYVLLDANVTAGYYLPRCLSSLKARARIENIFDAARSTAANLFFYLPNFCVAEVFSVFMKYSFGRWNKHVKKQTIDTRVYKSLVKQFEADIHNGKFIYHYELSRYHVLGINLVAPIDHYFRFHRGNKRYVAPMGTFDHLIVSMGVHLAHIHGPGNVLIVSTDDRLINILKKCRTGIKASTKRKLHLDAAEALTGKAFTPESFPLGINLKTATNKEMRAAFRDWPLPVANKPNVYRWTKLP